MLAISVHEAIRDAVAGFGAGKGEVALAPPATCEAIWMVIQQIKAPNAELHDSQRFQTASCKLQGRTHGNLKFWA
jgi:hypothetical protein